MKNTLEMILAAWRRFDDENDLARFDNFMEAAILVCDAIPSIYHADIVAALFAETPAVTETQEVESDG